MRSRRRARRHPRPQPVTIHPARTRPRFARLEPRSAIDLHEHQIGQRVLRLGFAGRYVLDDFIVAHSLKWTPPFEQRSLRRESLTSYTLPRFWLRALRDVQIPVIAQPLLHGQHDRGTFIALLHAINEPVDDRNR